MMKNITKKKRNRNNSIESFGLFVIGTVIGLYLYGIYHTIQSLPNNSIAIPTTITTTTTTGTSRSNNNNVIIGVTNTLNLPLDYQTEELDSESESKAKAKAESMKLKQIAFMQAQHVAMLKGVEAQKGNEINTDTTHDRQRKKDSIVSTTDNNNNDSNNQKGKGNAKGNNNNNNGNKIRRRTKVIIPPVGKWPVKSINPDNDHEDNFETMLHVGDLKTIMHVPRFWSQPLHMYNNIFTREQARKIGTCVEADPRTGSHIRGKECPVSQRTIFVGIASYRDYQCRHTVESIFHRAQYPHRIRVGVVDQIRMRQQEEGDNSTVQDDVRCNTPLQPCTIDPTQTLCRYKEQVDIYTMDARLSVGPVFARHIQYRLYRGEYYASQSDAHVSFAQNWDTDIIHQHEATHNEMAVLSTYLSDVQGSLDPQTGKSVTKTRPIMCQTEFDTESVQGVHLQHGQQPEGVPQIQGSPQLQPWWAAGYSFARGHFVVNVPYDPYSSTWIFQGEEMSIGIRGFTVGYDYYTPETSVCFHHYVTEHNNNKNKNDQQKIGDFYNDNEDKYSGTGKKAMKRLLGIVHMNPEIDRSTWDHIEEERYGVGTVRTPEQFYHYFGIDVVHKKIQHHLCQLIMDNCNDNGDDEATSVGDGKCWHKMVTPLLRPDGMGIDYSNFTYQWVDPDPDPENDDGPSSSSSSSHDDNEAKYREDELEKMNEAIRFLDSEKEKKKP